MPVWNPDALDYDSGVYKSDIGTIRTNKIGCWVMTIEEAKKARLERIKREQNENMF
jgi:hypothetical protein